MRPANTTALVGFMGAGKTTIGRALAARTDRPFVDLDELFVRRHGAIDDFFTRRGESAFRAVERALLCEVLAGPPVVLATGGGIVDDPYNVVDLERHAHTVFLDVPLERCAVRIGDAEGRPAWNQAVERFASRRPWYRLARTWIDNADGPDQTVDVLAASTDGVRDALDGRDSLHPVWIGETLDGLDEVVEAAGADGAVVITDSHVDRAWGEEVVRRIRPRARLVFPAGEERKTLATWRTLMDDLLANRPSRRTAIVALGGGVVGDLAGFVAASCLRGMPVVQVPTTTLAMIDSSVGGKTGVNHPAGKNLIGAFHPPAATWIATPTLSTLPPRHRRAGWAEAVKMAATHDAAAFGFLEVAADVLADPAITAAVVRHAVRTKAGVVHRDPLENGERRLLNAGHTAAHAIERALGFGELVHGEAVAIGLAVEHRWAAREGHVAGRVTDRIDRLLQRLGLPTVVPAGLDPMAFRAAVALDKKGVRDRLIIPIVRQLGSTTLVEVATTHFATSILDSAGNRDP